MDAQIKLRRDTEANWILYNPVLSEGEVGVDLDTLKFKIGDGANDWTTLLYSGTSGVDGNNGSSGVNGLTGSSGSSGTNGTSGLTGTSGSSGVNGLTGTSGNDGTSGSSGVNGSSGSSGVNGSSGSSGLTGTSGSSGLTGTSGSSGLTGTSGSSGLTGTSGSSGLTGTSGSSGLTGTSGSSGLTGTSGSSGLTGTSGSSGLTGTSGSSGSSGINGIDGTTNLIEQIDFNINIESVGTGSTILLSNYAFFPINITGISFKTNSGSCGIDLVINTTTITGLSSLTGGTANNIYYSSANNSVSVGDYVNLKLNTKTNCTDIFGSIKTIRI